MPVESAALTTAPATAALNDDLADLDPAVHQAIAAELRRQQSTLEMIASENFAPVAVMQAQGSVLTNKYAEGYPGRRYYGGCEHVDVIEQLAIDRITSLFGAKYANVQPHSGAQANAAAMAALLTGKSVRDGAAAIARIVGTTSALVVAVQNVAGQGMTQTEVRKLAQAPVPGDGCGVGLLRKSEEAPVLGTVCRNYPEFAGDMTGEVDPPRKYWEAGPGQWRVSFNEAKVVKVFARGNRLVPEVATAVCDQIGVHSRDVDLLVTNQPNRLFLRNWREALELPPEKHFDTFDECGNLFGAGIPVNLDMANRAGRIPNGALVLMSAFAHAGDFAGAAAVRWGAAASAERSEAIQHGSEPT